jgi:cytochrome P450
MIASPVVKTFLKFTEDSITDRIKLEVEQAEKPEIEQRQDIFHFLAQAKHPETGLPAYDEAHLRAESNLLLIAGSDTTAVSLAGVFFYLTGDPPRYQKLVEELQTTFNSIEDITYGPKLTNCKYLKACIDESMRLTPTGPSEPPRQVLPGGHWIKGEFYPAGTVVGTTYWANSRNEEVYGDPCVFRPERWIVNEAAGVTEESVIRMKANFQPFLSGPGSCVGKGLALMEIFLIVARTLYRFDIRRKPGSTLGGGSPELGWGARDSRQMQLGDRYVSWREGPVVQFRLRTLVNPEK